MFAVIYLIILIAAGALWYYVYPSFGARPNASSWLVSKNFNGKLFINQIVTTVDMSARDILSIIRQQLRHDGLRSPKEPIQPEAIDMQAFLSATTPQFIWLGHSTILMRLNGKTIVTDPILSMRSSPLSFAGPKRTISHRPILAKDLPPIDVVLISHDHYDHLDYETIRTLSDKTTKFFVSLGVAAHLRRWGIAADKIEELDWWDETTFHDLQLACTPARHFSGRRLGDRNKTLWCSWVIKTADTSLYFSGDSGYGPHFAEIGDKYGSFDLTFMECGQYDKLWPNVHMMPEDTVRAHHDLGGKRLFTIHWGAFVLALHPWTDPVKRAAKAATASGADLLSTKIGEMAAIKSPAQVSAQTQGLWVDQL